MNKEFLALLVHPISKKTLNFNSENNTLYDDTDNSFNILETVPLLIEKNETTETDFNYQEHYIKDAETYDYFEEWNPISKEENNRLHQHILSAIPKNADWVLDVGSGNAWLAAALCKMNRKVISMDISQTNPIKALKTYPSSFHFGLVADVYALPFAKNSMDCIVAAEIIEHVPDPKSFLEQLFFILKPGGTLIVTTPHNEHIQKSLCIHCNRLTPHNAHLHSFTAEKLKNLMPHDVQTNIQTKIINQKVLVRLRIQKVFHFLPFTFWKVIDKIAIKMSHNAFRLMMIVTKPIK